MECFVPISATSMHMFTTAVVRKVTQSIILSAVVVQGSSGIWAVCAYDDTLGRRSGSMEPVTNTSHRNKIEEEEEQYDD